MKVLISEVKIRKRVREDLGDLEPLMGSMDHNGQLNPITISRTNELIAGHRRLLAAEKLEWLYIDANVVDLKSDLEKLELELEENVHRKDFSPNELLEGYRRLEKLKRPTIAARVGGFFKGVWSKIVAVLPFQRQRRDDVVRRGSGTSLVSQRDDDPRSDLPLPAVTAGELQA